MNNPYQPPIVQDEQQDESDDKPEVWSDDPRNIVVLSIMAIVALAGMALLTMLF